MQYRVEKGDCTHRHFDEFNNSLSNEAWLYLETGG